MLTDLSVLQLILANLALLAGACLQGVAGYGIGTLSVPLLFLVNPALVPGVAMLNALVLTVLMMVRNHGGIQFRPVRYAIGGNVVGTGLGALTLMALSVKGFEFAFGGLILLAVLLSVVGIKPRLNARNNLLAGAASGYMGTITAVGGPPIALVYQNETGPLVRANLSAFFLFSCITGVIALTASGYIGVAELKALLLTCPGVVLGFWLSGFLVNRLPFAALRPIILTIAAFTGVAALVRGVLG
ncbi:sulfite exporter TauE/SafE family protein [Gilvimarinus sp. 1_MG-2023]|uniref:sulfite exporter TauE/SafE family protein n=1 Tax=Gilvimarinus sp. 1_MG-2023 TaxID=3062638 RepID=UPI0026E18E24|nr:sulfite exporter TauE/SafE family protein [Gilvimarinus sp. 1_MG-2023]MDO6748465.1 sulfite exporter TauE/SafE family protein [Gilvimarinus sp. 1_MG-2023]